MSTVFTDAELAYLASTAHGRLATQQPDGTLQVNPVGFRWNPDTGTIDIGGHGMSRSRKFRNVAANGRAAFVVDDITSTDPWRVRCLDLRGTAEAIADPGTTHRSTATIRRSSGSTRGGSSGWRSRTPASSPTRSARTPATCHLDDHGEPGPRDTRCGGVDLRR